MASQKEWIDDWENRALGLSEFSVRHGHSLSFTYLLVSQGKLKAVKSGRKSLVLPAEHKRYRESLQPLQPRNAAARAAAAEAAAKAEAAPAPAEPALPAPRRRRRSGGAS